MDLVKYNASFSHVDFMRVDDPQYYSVVVISFCYFIGSVFCNFKFLWNVFM